MTSEAKVRRALISVSNKEGIVDFAQGLEKLGVEIISTGGTAKKLEEAGIKVTPVSEITKFPEMLDGRVKTLHPAIHGGLLARRDIDDHLEQLSKQGIDPIDLVVVNLYPFAETIAKEGVTQEEAIENIDIGGPSMLRSAAKNFEAVGVVVNPQRYVSILEEMEKNSGSLSLETKTDLAKEAFEHTAQYDATIYGYLSENQEFAEVLSLSFAKIQDLRYGENPHQKAAYYKDQKAPASSLVYGSKLHGKELSFNNILDLDAAWRIILEFDEPAAVVIKHTNPCGTAVSDNVAKAYELAYACDPVSAFGSVVSVNRSVSKELAEKMSDKFVEAVIASSFEKEALDVLKQKENIRLIEMGDTDKSRGAQKDIRKIDGGILIQDMDESKETKEEMKVVTKREPTDEEWENLLFAWKVAKHVKSNSIVIAKNKQSIGVGAGQMSRVDASELAVKKAGKENCRGSVLASDAFFPFPDALEAAAEVGVTAVIEPGGAKKDNEVIAAADKQNIAMVFTGKRHFCH